MNTQGAHRYEDRLLEFAYGELPVAEARSIEAHVKGCARCSGALREIQGVRQQMSQLAPEPAPDAGLESLLAYAQQAARRTQAGPAPARGIRRWMFGIVGTASLAAVLLVVGVVSTRTRPELASLDPEKLKKEAALQELRTQESAVPAAAAAPAPVPQVAQGLAEEQQEQAKDQKEQPPPVAAAEKPSAERDAQVGKAVGTEYVQRVDVEDRKLGTREAPQYRQEGADRLDRGQNHIPGRGTAPVLPTDVEPSVASRKSGPLPADEFSFTPESKAKRSKAAPSKKKMMDGAGGGFGNALDSMGETRGPAPAAAAAPKSYDSDDLLPAAPSADIGETQDVLEAAPPPPAQEKLVAEAASRRREAELMEREQSRAAAMAKEEAPVELAKNARMRQAAPEPMPAPAPAAAPAASAPAPSSRAATPQVAYPGGAGLGLGSTSGAPAAPSAPMGVAGAKGDLSTAPARKAAATPPLQVAEAPRTSRSKAPSPSAQELFAEANRAPAGSPEQIDALIGALNAGLSGKARINALQRLCTSLETQGDDRAWSYCSAWASADPGSAIAAKRAKAAELRMQKSRAKAKPVDSKPAEAAPAKY